MTTQPWYDDEAGFASELARGRKNELRVAMRILPLGLSVKVGSFWFREEVGKDERAADQNDIEVEGGHLVEVKGTRFAFTSADDFPYDPAFVMSLRRWQARTVKPCCVVVISEATDAMFVIATSTHGQWVVQRKLDRRRGFVEEFLAAPRRLLLPEARLLAHLQHPCEQAR